MLDEKVYQEVTLRARSGTYRRCQSGEKSRKASEVRRPPGGAETGTVIRDDRETVLNSNSFEKEAEERRFSDS